MDPASWGPESIILSMDFFSAGEQICNQAKKEKEKKTKLWRYACYLFKNLWTTSLLVGVATCSAFLKSFAMFLLFPCEKEKILGNGIDISPSCNSMVSQGWTFVNVTGNVYEFQQQMKIKGTRHTFTVKYGHIHQWVILTIKKLLWLRISCLFGTISLPWTAPCDCQLPLPSLCGRRGWVLPPVCYFLISDFYAWEEVLQLWSLAVW